MGFFFGAVCVRFGMLHGHTVTPVLLGLIHGLVCAAYEALKAPGSLGLHTGQADADRKPQVGVFPKAYGLHDAYDAVRHKVCSVTVCMGQQNIAVRLRVKKKVQNLNAMWYKEFAKNFATQGDAVSSSKCNTQSLGIGVF